MVTAIFFIASNEASVAPAGPLPMIPTVLMGVLIRIRILVYDLATNGKLIAFFLRPSQSKTGEGFQLSDGIAA
jgi:hypothetical protein